MAEPSRAPSRDNPNQLEQLLAIADIARTVNDFRPLPETMELVCQRVTGMPACDWVTISLLKEDRLETTAWAGPGIRPEFMEWSRGEHSRHKSAWSPVYIASSSGRPVMITNVFAPHEWTMLSEGASIQGFSGAAYVPIMARGQALGTLNCYSRHPHHHSTEEVGLLQTVARLVGIAAETALIAERQRSAASQIQHLGLELTQRNDELSRLSHAQVRLAEALLEPGRNAAESICQLLCSELGGAAMICTLDGRPRAFAGPEQAHSVMAKALLRRDPIKLRRLADGSRVGSCSLQRIGHDRLLGFLLLHPALEPPTDSRAVLLKHAAALIAFELETERADRTTRGVARPNVLHALARASLSPRQARAAATFIDATGQPLRLGFASTPNDDLASQLAYRLNRTPNSSGCLVAAAEKDGILFLVEDGSPEQLQHVVSGFLAEAATEHGAVGLSDHFTDAARLDQALEEARMVLAVAAPGEIAVYDDLGHTAKLLGQLSPGQGNAFVERMISPLLEHDRSRTGALLPSLAAYIHHRKSLREASAELGIHPNTLQLRLARVAELTSLDLHDPLQLGLLALAIDWHRLRSRDRQINRDGPDSESSKGGRS